MIFLSRALARLSDKLKSLRLHYHSAYGPQVLQDGNLMDSYPQSHNPVITCSCKMILQTKTIVSSLPQCLWAPNLTG